MVKELKESKADKEIIKSSQKIIKEIKDRNKTIVPEIQEAPNESFNDGDYVSLKGTNTTGKILELFRDSKKANVLVGKVKMLVPLKSLIHSERKREEKREREYSYINSEVRNTT